MNLFNHPITIFTTKSGKKIEIWRPTMNRLPALMTFINRLVAEDTYLNLTGRPKTLAEEESWLKGTLAEIKAGKSLLFWAIYDQEIIGSVSVNRGFVRSWHVGKVGLMVDKDFRRDGIGKFLLDFILKESKKLGITIVILESFDENSVALDLYKKAGFKVYGRLPKGLFRKGKFSDTIKMYKEI